MLNYFKSIYPSTRVIIDCTDLKVERPPYLVFKYKRYSPYKSSHTWKGPAGIAAQEALTFESNLYTGSISDVKMTTLSGLIDSLDGSGSILTGFVLNTILERTGILVNTLPFLQDQGQFSR